MMTKYDFSRFKDILEIHRHGNDFQWITRIIQLKDAYISDKIPLTPQGLIHHVLNNENLVLRIRKRLESQNVPMQNVGNLINVILMEIGHRHDLSVVRWLGFALLKIIKKILCGLYINDSLLKQIKYSMGSNPVVFIPTHRSYADFILMAFVCFSYEIQIPCVAAGMDFYSMWLMGKLLRESKAFFMRRSFSDNEIYRSIFEEYVRAMVSLGKSPIEFFIEGTRSRSAKALMPKLGFLAMVLEPFFRGEVPDISIVPISISYDRLLEEVLFAYELLGIPKPKESTFGLLKALNTLGQSYGNVHVNFSEPISARRFFESDIDFKLRSKDQEHHQIVMLAHTIIRRQQEAQILGCFNLISIILCNHLCNQKQELTLNELCTDISWIKSIFEQIGASVYINGNIETTVTNTIRRHNNVVQISENGIINIVQISHWNQNTNVLQGGVLDSHVIIEAVPMMILQLYVNPCLHFLSRLSFLTVLLNSMKFSPIATKDELQLDYEILSCLFSHEFVILQNTLKEDFEESLNQLEYLKVIHVGGVNVSLRKDNKLIALLRNVLYPFLVGYFIVCSVLLEDCEIKIKEKYIFQQSQISAGKLLISGQIKHHYTLSLNLLGCALRALTDMEVIKKEKENGEVVFTVECSRITVVWELLNCLMHLPGLGRIIESRKSCLYSLGDKAKL